jgi:arylsulfatase A-like enzyme
MAQMFKLAGYATGMVGKWHLGDAPQFLPTRHGFDEWLGIPYSHDMAPKHPGPSQKYPDLPLMENEKVVRTNPDPAELTTLYTERAVQFIGRNKDKPFFLYLAHNLPHVPLGVSEKFAGKSGRGIYADVIEEIDWSVGQVTKAIDDANLGSVTLIIFMSDNGPWLLYGNHAGSALPLREGKMTSFDGGVRVPCLMRWPGKIPASATQSQLAATIDLLPTLAKLAGATLPTDRIIDGKDIWPLMTAQPGAVCPHDAYYIYWGRQLQAIRMGKWKMHFDHDYIHPDPPGADGKPGKTVALHIGFELFDLEADESEKTDVAKDHPDVVAKMQALAAIAREDLGDAKTKQTGKNLREPGRIAENRGFRWPGDVGPLESFAFHQRSSEQYDVDRD